MFSAIHQLKEHLADIDALHAALAMMEWDQQTYMPRGSSDARAEHLSVLSRMVHDRFTNDVFAKLVDEASPESADDIALLRIVRRDLALKTKIPSDLVAEKSRLGAIAHEDWMRARANNDFKSFAPNLTRMFDIAREEAEHLGYVEHIYDALLDQYEEGATAADARSMFETVKGPQVELVRQISECAPVDDAFLYGEWSIPDQSKFTEMLVSKIGFDLNRGRQDTAPHPFCTNWSVNDVRLTTRYQPYLGSVIFGSLHEAGHGMYEQGSPAAWDRTPLAGGVSLGVHESQSRFWENIIGRSKGFWKHFLPELNSAFPGLGNPSVDQFYRAVNKVKSSFIRVEADELTYNLHVLIRFEIECDILTGALSVNDLPDAWNAKYQKYLGVTPATDSDGCLQDVHWSGGMIGYFPTYSMGNLLSYQIWNSLRKDVPNADELVESGNFEPILDWLVSHVYSKGRSIPPKDLVLQVTGKPLGAEDYLEGLSAKYRELYSL